MAVYHFTLHAYRSWRPDHQRGYTLYGEGYLPSDEIQADEYDKNANQPPVTFNRKIQKLILLHTYDICRREGWRLEATGSDPSHVHQLISWKTYRKWEDVDQRLKNLLALRLNKHFKSPGKRWFVRRHGAPRGVRTRKHYDYLVTTYFPDHPGLFWKRGKPLPKDG